LPPPNCEPEYRQKYRCKKYRRNACYHCESGGASYCPQSVESAGSPMMAINAEAQYSQANRRTFFGIPGPPAL
jgi:hypothetical protein